MELCGLSHYIGRNRGPAKPFSPCHVFAWRAWANSGRKSGWLAALNGPHLTIRITARRRCARSTDRSCRRSLRGVTSAFCDAKRDSESMPDAASHPTTLTIHVSATTSAREGIAHDPQIAHVARARRERQPPPVGMRAQVAHALHVEGEHGRCAAGGRQPP